MSRGERIDSVFFLVVPFFFSQSRWTDDGLFKFDYLMMMRNVNLSRVSVSLAMSAIRKIDPEHWTMRRMCNWSFSHTHRTVRMWMKSNFRSIACTRFVEESHIMSEANSLGSDIIMMTDERISSLSFSVCFFFLLNCQSGFFTYCRKLYPFRFFLWSLVKKKKETEM